MQRVGFICGKLLAKSSIMKTEFSFFNASEHIITSPM